MLVAIFNQCVQLIYIKGDFLILYAFQHCFICRSSDSTVSEDAGIEPRNVATTSTARRSNHSARSHVCYICNDLERLGWRVKISSCVSLSFGVISRLGRAVGQCFHGLHNIAPSTAAAHMHGSIPGNHNIAYCISSRFTRHHIPMVLDFLVTAYNMSPCFKRIYVSPNL